MEAATMSIVIQCYLTLKYLQQLLLIYLFSTDADQRAVLNVLNDRSLKYPQLVYPFDTWVQIGLTADATNYNFRGFVNKNFVVSGYCSGGVDDTCSLFTMPNGYWLFNVKIWKIGSIYSVG